MPKSEALNAAEVAKTLIRFVKDLTSGTEEVTRLDRDVDMDMMGVDRC